MIIKISDQRSCSFPVWTFYRHRFLPSTMPWSLKAMTSVSSVTFISFSISIVPKYSSMTGTGSSLIGWSGRQFGPITVCQMLSRREKTTAESTSSDTVWNLKIINGITTFTSLYSNKGSSLRRSLAIHMRHSSCSWMMDMKAGHNVQSYSHESERSTCLHSMY